GTRPLRAGGVVRSRSRLCRVAGLSSAAAWGSEIRMSEGRAADKFANFPHDASSARNPEGARTSARLSLAYVWCLRNFASQSEQTPRGTRLWRTKKTRFAGFIKGRSAAGPRPGQAKPPERK